MNKFFAIFILSLILIQHERIYADTNLIEGIEFKTIHYPGNIADLDTNLGAVDKNFFAGKYEITNEQYALFLNSVAKEGDPFNLYTPLMEEHFWGGIIRQQNNDKYIYISKLGYEQLPVTYISWFDAIRFINWLHYGRPAPGFSGLGVTEGTDSIGAYDTRYGVVARTRNQNAKFWLPTKNERYKAAYFDGAADRYWKYATGNELPLSDLTSDKKSVTYFDGNWAAPFPHLSIVGAHISSPSPFGLFDMAGNVMEWSEETIGINKVALGGSVFMSESSLSPSYSDSERPELKLSTFGFRVYATHDVVETPSPTIVKSTPFDDTENIRIINGYQYLLVDDADFYEFSIDKRGVVNYPYLIGRTAVTNQQWVDMLNEIGYSKAIEFCLYNLAMTSGVAGGIELNIEKDLINFQVKPGWGKRPITYISWYAAARYSNFQHYKRKRDTNIVHSTEGSKYTGAYDTTQFPECGDESHNPSLIPDSRNDGALVFLPTIDEWYKAAFFDRTKSGEFKYWKYPTRSDIPPNNLAPPGDNHSANYQVGNTLGEGAPYYVSEVDAYPYARSPYNTLGQAGNVWEWVESWRSKGEGNCWRCSEWTKGLMGGSFNYIYIGLSSSNIDPGAMHHTYPFYGLRLAASPNEDGFLTQKHHISFMAVIFQELKYRLKMADNKNLIIIGFLFGLLFCIVFGLITYFLKLYTLKI
ncbi:formylglycine-generating enzyme family protein [Methylophaga sp. SB9B]|uniref:formylglycine-generating enzyme family protein n=1 Tax=Methylophaga sp. SB9B TaxID=2570356 RepID=UPI0010A81923|nr:SUMF1/EgtB/PvdO family nonheme iron enzyme [Methylophaga sp. SB9B]THK41173.1 formylglycine-generating enzyme family protein [Methylophaga sp. SB9B]